MALSNIRKEPRREITESLLGILAVILVLGGDYLLSHWLHIKDSHMHPKNIMPTIAFMVFVPLFFLVAYFVLTFIAYLTHSFGESICGWLQDMGMDPRPKTRYR